MKVKNELINFIIGGNYLKNNVDYHFSSIFLISEHFGYETMIIVRSSYQQCFQNILPIVL